MSTKELYHVKKLRKFADCEIDRKSQTRSKSTPVKNWRLTYINKVDAKIGAVVPVEARDYIQALEHALYIAGFILEKVPKKA
jgi:hypothetical protein